MKKVVLSVLLILCVFSVFASNSTFESTKINNGTILVDPVGFGIRKSIMHPKTLGDVVAVIDFRNLSNKTFSKTTFILGLFDENGKLVDIMQAEYNKSLKPKEKSGNTDFRIEDYTNVEYCAVLSIYIDYADGTSDEFENINAYNKKEKMDFIKKAYNEICYGEFVCGNCVDEFGDETGTKYVGIDCAGTFSNTATSKSELNAILIIGKDMAYIKLYEYGHNAILSAPAFFIIKESTIKVKCDNGEVITLDSCCKDDYIQIMNMNLLLKTLYYNDNVKFSITVGDNSHYNFLVRTYGFAKAYTDTFLID